MKRKILYCALIVILLIMIAPAIQAQEKKPFPAYIEITLPFFLSNQGFVDSYETNVNFRATGTAESISEIEELQYQSISIGWEFPRKGKIVVTYSDFKEESSDTLINHKYVFPNGLLLVDEYYDPDPFDDDYYNGPANYLIKVLDSNIKLETRLIDAVFTREFGKGRRFGGSWNAGLRLTKHDQNLPVGAYFPYFLPDGEFQYTYFSPAPFYINQNSSFIGPKGGGEIHLYLFNKRLILSGGADISIGFGNIEVPTQSFGRGKINADWQSVIFPYEEFPFSEKKSKNPIFTTFDVNAKFRIFKELYAFVGYKITTFRDIYLSPTVVDLPTAKDMSPYGLFMSFSAEDVSYETPYFGISYQF